MKNKLLVLLLVATIIFAVSGCQSSETSTEQVEKIWIGQFVQTNEETGEVKIATVTEETETGVSIHFKSVRSSDEFDANFESSSGKYAVLDNGERCLNFKLKANETMIAVDDIWMNPQKQRNENWAGKYQRLEEDEQVPTFGNKDWNGEYENIDTELEISVYGILKNTVLITYNDPFTTSKSGKSNIVCTGKGNKCVYDFEGRRLEIELNKDDKMVEIKDENTAENEGWLNLGGVYKLK